MGERYRSALANLRGVGTVGAEGADLDHRKVKL